MLEIRAFRSHAHLLELLQDFQFQISLIMLAGWHSCLNKLKGKKKKVKDKVISVLLPVFVSPSPAQHLPFFVSLLNADLVMSESHPEHCHYLTASVLQCPETIISKLT